MASAHLPEIRIHPRDVLVERTAIGRLISVVGERGEVRFSPPRSHRVNPAKTLGAGGPSTQIAVDGVVYNSVNPAIPASRPSSDAETAGDMG